MSDPVQVKHEQERERFSAQVDGHECELDYQVEAGVLTILHTGVPAAVGGRGVAGALTAAALAFARAGGLKVRPACSYAAVYFRRHPEAGDLLA